jgi:hypothetical protein
MESFKSGETVGNGAAQNIQLGWIPDLVIVNNVTGGDRMSVGYPNRMAIPFSSGGTVDIEAGDTITGRTSGATAIVESVLLYSGTFAAGDAAGFIIIERDSLTGTFESEGVNVNDVDSDGATVTANVTHTVEVDLDNLALVTGTSAISAYVGASGSASKGFTIGAVIAEEAHLLRWSAWRNDR